MKKVAILGGGNGAHAMAADLTVKGLEVTICEAPEFKVGFGTVLERQSIQLIDPWGEEREVKLHKATTDFKEAIAGADCIMMVVPATGHQRFFSAIMPYLENGQIVISWPGNYAALLFASMLDKEGMRGKVTLAEGHTLPWGCRLEAPARVRIFVEAWNLLVAALPATRTARVVEDLRDIYPVTAGENVLATSLNNLNPIVHPTGAVLNAGWIDTLGKEFYFYKHGTTLSIARAIEAVYEETRMTAEAAGGKMLEYPEESFRSKATIMSHYFKAPFDIEGTVARISGPSSMKARYITEDIPYGLVPVALLARKFGIPTPTIDAIVHLASVMNQTDYLKKGRSLEELGIAELGKEGLMKMLGEG
ncbi:MAG: NAD/NADP octopine/nopaline dehydrogenase family protein [Dehalococcoidia bacterium]